MADTAGQSTTAQFGESQFGERLNYSKPQYRDLWAALLFYIHVAGIIALAVYVWVVDTSSTEDTTATTTTLSPTNTLEPAYDDYNTAGIWITLVCTLVAGALFGLLWLKCIQLFAETIIKILLGVSIALWLIVAVIGLLYNAIYILAVGVIMALLTGLYAYCIWRRIPFAGACLSIASTITQDYPGVIWISFASVFINFIWTIIWIMAVWALLLQGDIGSLGEFLLLISLYWGVNVWRNCSHTTTCGVAATWYFNAGKLVNPSPAAFKRTMTTSFGSICFGSLLVAILSAIRAMVRSRGGGCIVDCILGCIEWLMQYFNKYAFAQVAIYGSSYWTAAKSTWDLFTTRLIVAIINDDLSGLALTCGALLGAVVSGIIGYVVADVFYDDIMFKIALCVIGAVFGYYVVAIILLTVASGVVAIFVCFAEDPAACYSNRPDAYQKLTMVSEDMANMARGQGVPLR